MKISAAEWRVLDGFFCRTLGLYLHARGVLSKEDYEAAQWRAFDAVTALPGGWSGLAALKDKLETCLNAAERVERRRARKLALVGNDE
jgi:hypothetical protein